MALMLRKKFVFVYLFLLFSYVVSHPTESTEKPNKESKNELEAPENQVDESASKPSSENEEPSEKAKDESKEEKAEGDEMSVEAATDGVEATPKENIEKTESEEKEGEEKDNEEKEENNKGEKEGEESEKEGEESEKEETTENNKVAEGENETIPPSKEESKEIAPSNTFGVWNSKGKICILAKFQSSIAIAHGKNAGKVQYLYLDEVLIPSKSTVRGKCASVDESPNMEFSWGKFLFTLFFDKISDDSWGVTSVELTFDTSDRIFDGVDDRGEVTAKSKKLELFETPLGKSYYCPGQEIIHLYSEDKETATVRLKEIHLQPYHIEDGKFSTWHRCSSVVISEEEPFVQDETVPLAIGCTLALITLFVLVGVSVHRAYNAAKVDYNSME